jgi:hypothetical protein
MKMLSLIFILFMMGVMVSCHKDQPDDPCKNYQKSNADFDFWAPVYFGGFFEHTYTDDTFGSNYVDFVAKYDAEKYIWTVGAKTYTTKKFSIFFGPSADVPAPADGTQIPVTLITYKTPSARCDAKDDGWDTVTKLLTIDNRRPFIYTGTYKIWDINNPNFTYIMTMKDTNVLGSSSEWFIFTNFPNGFNPLLYLNGSSQRAFRVSGGGKPNTKSDYLVDAQIVWGKNHTDVDIYMWTNIPNDTTKKPINYTETYSTLKGIKIK